MPGSDGEDDGVAPEQQHEDDDDDLRGGQVGLWDSPPVQGREHDSLVVQVQNIHLRNENIHQVRFYLNFNESHIYFSAVSSIFKWKINFFYEYFSHCVPNPLSQSEN